VARAVISARPRACLPLRLALGDEESLAGFLVRLGERNQGQVRTMLNAARAAGAPYWSSGAMLEREIDLDGLAWMSGVPADRLAAAAFPQAGPRLNLFGTGKVHRRHLTTSERRVCPACLEEDGYHRRLWHLAVAASCPQHAVRLIGDCAACGGRLRWGNGKLASCLCGWELQRARAEFVERDRLRGLATICMLLGIESEVHSEGIGLAGRVTKLPTQDVIDLILHLGWLKQENRPLPRRIARIGPALDGVLTDGALILADWPKAFHRLLDEQLLNRADRAGRFGLRFDLGAVAGWIHSLPKDSPLGGLLRLELARWWAARPVAPTRAPRLRRAHAGHFTLTQAASLLRIRCEAIKDSLALGLVTEEAGLGSGAPVFLERGRILRARALLDDLVGHREAARILGCGRKTFAGLVACGALAEADARRRRLPGPRKWSRAGLLRCLAAVPSEGAAPASADADDLVSLRDAITWLRQGGRDLAGIWKALRAGKLTPVFVMPEQRGLQAMVAYRDDVVELARRRRHRKCGLKVGPRPTQLMTASPISRRV
jgi:hypothetical protein